jgi:hypothetical protein
MYLHDRTQAVSDLSERLTTDRRMSITFRNGHALATRPGLRGDGAAALAALDSIAYVNELGLPAHASRAEGIEAGLASADCDLLPGMVSEYSRMLWQLTSLHPVWRR